MKSFRNIFIIIFSLFIFVFTGCEDQVLDKSPRDSFSENAVFGDLELVKMYVSANYNSLPTNVSYIWTNNPPWIDGMSDNAYALHDYGIRTYQLGEISPSSSGMWGSMWSNKYSAIKNLNVFFEKIGEVEGDQDEIDRLIAEMKVIRAWNYHMLVNCFGGVPLITSTFGLQDDFTVDRDTYQDCIDFILTEIEEALPDLPAKASASDFGRIDKGAALGLKMRTLLYAARKLHDPATQPNGPLFDYNQSGKWEKVASVCEEIMDMGYSLTPVETWEDYQALFTYRHDEIIYAHPQNPSFSGRAIDRHFSTNGFEGWGSLNPTHSFVQEFQMSDGLSIDESPLYDPSPATIYQNRELRFYADIQYNGCTYRGRVLEIYTPGGLDGKQGPAHHDASETGYMPRKHTLENFDFKSYASTAPIVVFRLAEVYLNYAEAQLNLGNEDVAREYINKVRTRAKLPPITSSGDQLLEDYRHERNIELCFEAHRFWDLLGWMIAPEKLNGTPDGIEWKYVDAQGQLDPLGELTYGIINVEWRTFLEDRMYYGPIPDSEMQRTNLQQNPGYPTQ
jgi:starch-binding outer membrane protein, SusD/RagB family